MRRVNIFIVLAAAAITAAGITGTRADHNSPHDVRYLDAKQVADAFDRGVPLIEVPGYKIHASRRVEPGKAEVHLTDTDIVHVLQGTAVVVTGGEVVGGKTTAPREIRGDSIRGGDVRELKPGDVMVIPDGVPHWFRQVDGPFLYYVVKVPTGDGGRP